MSKKLKLRVLWNKKFFGVAVDQVHEKATFPLTSYYFWPQTDAWEQLKLGLDTKMWLDESEKIKLLNLTADLMKIWQSGYTRITDELIKQQCTSVKFSKLES